MEYKISEAAEKVGLTDYTLRYYEKEGLLPEVKRNKSGIRIYSDNDIVWIDLVRCLRDTGMPISEIRSIVQLSVLGSSTIPKRKQILEKHKEDLEKQIKELTKSINKIHRKLDWYDGKISDCQL